MPMRARAMRAVLLATLAAFSCSAVDRTRLYASAKAPKDDSAKVDPRLKLSCAVRPCIKLRKSIEALGTTLSFGADYHVREKEAHFETTWHDPRLGGQLSLRDLSRLEWRKTWLFPGLADAATRVEVRSTLDLRTAQPDVRLKLGLRRSFASSSMSFVQDVPLDGSDGHCKVSVGATLTVREQGHTAQWQCPSSAPTPPQGTPGGSRLVRNTGRPATSRGPRGSCLRGYCEVTDVCRHSSLSLFPPRGPIGGWGGVGRWLCACPAVRVGALWLHSLAAAARGSPLDGARRVPLDGARRVAH